MTVRAQIETLLQQGLTPTHLAIVDESQRHAGHAGANPEGESHFHIEIVSPQFEGKTRVARQRLVYDLLAELMKTRIHALSLATFAPSEVKQ